MRNNTEVRFWTVYLFVITSFSFLLLYTTSSQAVQIEVPSDSELTPDALFTNLISNTADITGGEMIIEYKNPINNFYMNNISADFIKGRGRGIDSYEVYINKTIQIQKVNISRQFVQQNCTDPTYPYDCNYYNINYTYWNDTGEGWERVIKDTIRDKGSFKIKYITHWKAGLGAQETDVQPVVILPKDKLGKAQDLKVKQSKWAWQNVSFNNRVNISLNTTTLLNATNYSAYVNVTAYSAFNASIRFVNETDTSELGFWFENDTCYANYCWAYVLIDRNFSAAQNYTLKMYYNYSVETSTSSKSNISAAGLWGDNFSGAIDWTNRWQSNAQASWAQTNNNGGLLIGIGDATTANNFQTQAKFNSTSDTNYTIMVRMNATVPSNFKGLYPGVNNLAFDGFATTQEVVKSNTDATRTSMGSPSGVTLTGGAIVGGQFNIYKATVAPRGNYSIENENGTILINDTRAIPMNTSHFGLLTYVDANIGVDWIFVKREYPYVVTQTFGTVENQNSSAASSCTYGGSGLWTLNSYENCSVSTNTILPAGQNVTVVAGGNITISANISNFSHFYIAPGAWVYINASAAGRIITR